MMFFKLVVSHYVALIIFLDSLIVELNWNNLNLDVFEIDGEQYVAAHDLLESLIDELDWDEPKIISSFKGQEADKIVSKHPFYDRDILTMLGTHVTTEAGTGCVHTAPGHGEE